MWREVLGVLEVGGLVLADDVVEEREEDLVLAVEVVVQRRALDPDLVGDVLQARLAEPPLVEQRGGAVDDGVRHQVASCRARAHFSAGHDA